MRILVILLSAAVVGVGVFFYASSDAASCTDSIPAPAVVPAPQRPSAAASAPAAPASRQIPAATIMELAADAQSSNPAKRAAAIAGLGNAPRAEALPILKNVLTSGEIHVDRPLALRSLRALAQRDGDADGAVRDIVRQSVYHSEAEEFTRAAQAALDDIEMLVTKR